MQGLYEARMAEREYLRLAVERATSGQIRALTTILKHKESVPPNTSVRELVALNESFHLQIADMAGNAELRRMPASLNERIRFIRWIDMETGGRDSTQKEHQKIARALKARDWAAGERLLGAHIGLRREQIVEAITRGLARIYLVEGAVS